jgi:hypothetical protein
MYDAGGESAYYVCELFGDDVPNVFAKCDGCCLHPNEVKKALTLRDNALIWTYTGYEHELTEYEKRMIRKTSNEYNKYMKHLIEKYAEGKK